MIIMTLFSKKRVKFICDFNGERTNNYSYNKEEYYIIMENSKMNNNNNDKKKKI